MNFRALIFLTMTGFTASNVLAENSSAPSNPLAWPALTKENRPGTRWWWMGSAVDLTNLARELKTFHEAGLGTVEITPIYGVKGAESQFIDYLSPQWMEMLKSTVSLAQKLDLNVDMVTGTGWCFGGPKVSDHDANALAVVKTFDVEANADFTEKFDRSTTQTLMAFSPDGKSVDLTSQIAANGAVNWKPTSAGPWRVYAISQKPSGVVVKRPAPGGAGPMLNLLSTKAMPDYLQIFSEAFAKYDGPKPHAQFHDSYEYKSDWSPDFLAQFAQRRGYPLQTELPALFEDRGDPDHVARVKSDYRETVSEAVEQSIAAWTRWSHAHGFITREQAHGSPGNWLDIYAAADIPETEMYNQDRDILVSKFASSAAHVTGRNLVSSETGTWVAEHFTETLADLKTLFDDMYLAGVNRIMYHGTAYSPEDAAWPGWCFYASTEMNPRNSIWRDVPALNTYAARVQSMLQSGQPDNDILLYWPIADQWHNAEGMMQQMSIHGRDWFDKLPIGKTARLLRERGYTFDYISDKQLLNAKVESGALDLLGNKYRVIVVPSCEHMPVETAEKLLALASSGATVIFQGQFPTEVPGLNNAAKGREQLHEITAKLAAVGASKEIAGRGHWRVMTGEVEDALEQTAAQPEELGADRGIHFIRRVIEGGFIYFISNGGTQTLDQVVHLSKLAAQVAIFDPISGQIGLAETSSAENGAQVHLQLEPGASLLLRTFDKPTAQAAAWSYWQPTGEPVIINGNWDVKFLAGGPTLPAEFSTEKLGSWTEAGGADAQNFGGTARYTLHFDAPKTPAQHWALDLGNVAQSARVWLNGQDLGTLFLPPFRVLTEGLKAKDNVLEVEVTSTSANRIRDLDQRGVKWKIFYDANVMNLKSKPFDASEWPLAAAGLLGPVTLQPQKQ